MGYGWKDLWKVTLPLFLTLNSKNMQTPKERYLKLSQQLLDIANEAALSTQERRDATTAYAQARIDKETLIAVHIEEDRKLKSMDSRAKEIRRQQRAIAAGRDPNKRKRKK